MNEPKNDRAVAPNTTEGERSIPVAVRAMDKGLRSFAKSAITVADYACIHPDEIETAIEAVTVISKNLDALVDSVSDFAETGKKLGGVVEEASQVAGWLNGRFPGSENNQSVPTTNSLGRVVSSFGELL